MKLGFVNIHKDAFNFPTVCTQCGVFVQLSKSFAPLNEDEKLEYYCKTCAVEVDPTLEERIDRNI